MTDSTLDFCAELEAKIKAGIFDDYLIMGPLARKRALDVLRLDGGPMPYDDLVKEVRLFCGQWCDYKYRDADEDISQLPPDWVRYFEWSGTRHVQITTKGYMGME